METQTYHEAEAQRLGWPASVCGYSPNEAYYYHENLRWVNALLNPEHHGLDPAKAKAELRNLRVLPPMWNENMAPRFPTGTSVAGKQLKVGQPVPIGAVVCFWLAGEVWECPEWARVVSCRHGQLRLVCDNGQRPYCLPWGKQDAPRVGRVFVATHYMRLPYPGHEPAS